MHPHNRALHHASCLCRYEVHCYIGSQDCNARVALHNILRQTQTERDIKTERCEHSRFIVAVLSEQDVIFCKNSSNLTPGLNDSSMQVAIPLSSYSRTPPCDHLTIARTPHHYSHPCSVLNCIPQCKECYVSPL